MARRRRNPEIIAGRVNFDGTIAATGTGDWTVTKPSTGTYIIMGPPGFRVVSADVTQSVYNSSVWETYVDSFSGPSFRVLLFSSAGAEVANSFAFVAVGVQQ